MTPAQAQALYARQIDRHGETITLRRINPAPAAPTDQAVRARVTGYAPHELAGGIQQGDRKVIVLAADVATPPRVNDRIVLAGAKVLNVQAIDDQTRRLAGVLIAYEITARG